MIFEIKWKLQEEIKTNSRNPYLYVVEDSEDKEEFNYILFY